VSRHLHAIITVAGLGESTGGPARAIIGHAEAVAAMPEMLASIIYGEMAEPPMLAHDGVAMFGVPMGPARLPGGRGFGGAMDLVRAAAPGMPAVIHDHGLWLPSNIAAARAARHRGLPYLVSTHGMLEPWALGYRGGRKLVAWLLYQRRLLEGAAALVCNAEPERATVIAAMPGRPVAVIPNSVAMPEEVAAGPRPRTLLFLSRLHPVKNLPGLLDAWAMVAPDFPEWRLRIAGPDETGLGPDLSARIAAMGAAGERVRLEGAVADADKAAVLAGAALFVLPSFSENFGLVAAEALAHGLPVIASTGTPWSGLAQAGCGWQAAPDPVSLAAALRTAMALPPEALAAMGAAGRNYVEARFSPARIGEQLVELYHWAAGLGARPAFVQG
jgi:glycosyltransferase involved in cell wall biosynthesis